MGTYEEIYWEKPLFQMSEDSVEYFLQYSFVNVTIFNKSRSEE